MGERQEWRERIKQHGSEPSFRLAAMCGALVINDHELGDIVSIAGIISPLKGGQTPVLSVRRYADTSSNTLGVVQTRMVIVPEEANALKGGTLQIVAMEVHPAIL
jgi:hypothetical protein